MVVAGCRREPEEGGERRPVEREASHRRSEEEAVGAGALVDGGRRPPLVARGRCVIEMGKPGRWG